MKVTYCMSQLETMNYTRDIMFMVDVIVQR